MTTMSRPLRIVFVTPKNPQSATSRYRCHHLAEALQLTHPTVQIAIHSVTDTRFSLDAPDIVVLHRLRFHGEADRVLHATRATGAVAVASVDDMIFSPEYAYQVGLTSPPDDPAFYRYHRDEADDHLRTMRECDAVITSTEFLAKEARIALENSKPVHCVRNFLNADMVRLSDAAYELHTRRLALAPATRTLAYLSGSPTHDVDFAEIAPTLARVLSKQENTRLLLVGTVTLPKALLPFADSGRIRRHPFVSWRDLFGLTAQADVTLAPLDASRLFNHAKSEIKLLEAGMVGVPTVATYTEGVAETGTNLGIHCRTAADWEAALTRLLETDAASVGEASRGIVAAHSTVTAVAPTVAATFAELSDLKTGTSSGKAEVVRPWRERLSENLRAAEAKWFQRKIKLQRHWRLLEAELEKKG